MVILLRCESHETPKKLDMKTIHFFLCSFFQNENSQQEELQDFIYNLKFNSKHWIRYSQLIKMSWCIEYFWVAAFKKAFRVAKKVFTENICFFWNPNWITYILEKTKQTHQISAAKYHRDLRKIKFFLNPLSSGFSRRFMSPRKRFWKKCPYGFLDFRISVKR